MEPVDILKVIGTAVLPISELRGAIPLAIGTYHFPWYYAYIFGVIGNLIPIPFILLFFEAVTPLLGRVVFLNKMVQWYLNWTRRRAKSIERYGWFGLAIFVAIPLPITGAWTGSILAALLGKNFKYAFSAVALGVLLAGVIVTCATMLGWAVAGLFTA